MSSEALDNQSLPQSQLPRTSYDFQLPRDYGTDYFIQPSAPIEIPRQARRIFKFERQILLPSSNLLSPGPHELYGGDGAMFRGETRPNQAPFRPFSNEAGREPGARDGITVEGTLSLPTFSPSNLSQDYLVAPGHPQNSKQRSTSAPTITASNSSSSPSDPSLPSLSLDPPSSWKVQESTPKAEPSSSSLSHTSSTPILFPLGDDPPLSPEVQESTPRAESLPISSNSSDSSSTPSLLSTGDDPPSSPELQEPRPKEPTPSNFKSRNDDRSFVSTMYAVFGLMATDIVTKAPKEGCVAKEGCVYLLRTAAFPGFIKFGYTTRPIEVRMKEINRCVDHKLEIVDPDYSRAQYPNYKRVEKLVHEELSTCRRCFDCPCKRARRIGSEFKSDGNRKEGTHGEWFETSEEKALEVVRRWRNWMSTDPYIDGKLRFKEVLRINAYAGNSDTMKSMLTETGQDWRWDRFMSTSSLYLEYLWLCNFFCAKRVIDESDCSRLDSVLKHWKSNVIFGLSVTAVSILLSALPVLFPSSALFLTLITLIPGLVGVIYAA